MALFITACVLGSAWAGAARGQPISADPTVMPVSLTTFAGLTREEVWQGLDGAAYWSVPRQAPPGYYNGIDTTGAASLRATLHALIAAYPVVPYTDPSRPGQAGHKVDVWDVMALADAHPHQPARVLDIYQNATFDRQLTGPTTTPRYDREHSWPKSLGFPEETDRNRAYSDCHHLFAAFNTYNQSRGDRPYGEGPDEPARRRATEPNLGRGGSLQPVGASSNYSYTDRWQTWLGRRGDVARAMFYMDVRYEGGNEEPDLVLTDDITLVRGLNVWEDGGQAFMGLLTVLIKWHADDPVDDVERRRNGVVYLLQGNRNPFIDHPEWVGVVFGGQAIPHTPPDAGGVVGPVTPPGPAATGGTIANVWINEIHYDNDGEDADEFVEICGAAGTSLVGWRIVAYNGGDGGAYRTVTLGNSVPNHAGGFGAVSVTVAGLQNGAPDGIALVDAGGRVVEFISYEGQFAAADGPAAGRAAVAIGVAEESNTPAGLSIQRRGHGDTGAAFAWHGPEPASPGAINDGQTFD